jgi:radical SAM superfamily enzyme YgiQ (UPF0313 family)
MKVLLINPPWMKGFNRASRWSSKSVSETVSEPIYLAYATAVVQRDTKAEVMLKDAHALGWSIEDYSNYIKSWKPDLVVIESSTPSFKSDITAIEMAKNVGSIVMLIGTHGSVFFKETLEKFPVDIVAIGEYDLTVADVVNNINDLTNVKGIAFKKDGNIIQTEPRPLIENLDSLPFPAREFLPMEKYRESNATAVPFARMVSSRGCTGRCIFCVYNQILFKERFRARSPENVVNEMEYLIDKYHVKYIYIDDDTFTINKSRVHKICDLIIEKGINKKIDWSTLSRIDTVDFELLKHMKDAGCKVIIYGVESGNQNVLNLMKKGVTLDQIRQTFKWTKDVGMKIHATFMFGSPGETKETIKETIRFAKELNPDTAQFPICMPYPGTEFYKIAEENGWLKIKDWSDFYSATDKAVIQTSELTPEDLEKAVKVAYKDFYLRPSYIFRKLIDIRNYAELKQIIRGGMALMGSLETEEKL